MWTLNSVFLPFCTNKFHKTCTRNPKQTYFFYLIFPCLLTTRSTNFVQQICKNAFPTSTVNNSEFQLQELIVFYLGKWVLFVMACMVVEELLNCTSCAACSNRCTVKLLIWTFWQFGALCSCEIWVFLAGVAKIACHLEFDTV